MQTPPTGATRRQALRRVIKAGIAGGFQVGGSQRGASKYVTQSMLSLNGQLIG